VHYFQLGGVTLNHVKSSVTNRGRKTKVEPANAGWHRKRLLQWRR